MQSSAYGASLAGGTFDFLDFLKQPQTVLRFLSWVSDYTETLASKLARCHRPNFNRCGLLESTQTNQSNSLLASWAADSRYELGFRLNFKRNVL